MSHQPGYDQKPRSRYAVISGEQPVIDQGDPPDSKWMQAGGDARDRGRVGGDLIRGTAGTAMFIPAGVPHRIEKPRQPP
jgi:hypothetical protein